MRQGMLDKDKIKESLTTDDITKILHELGAGDPLWSGDGNNLRYTTVCHEGDGHNLNYYTDSHHFHCYSNCGGMDIYELIIKTKENQGVELTFPEAVKYVAELTGKTYSVSRELGHSNDRIDDWNWLERITKKKPKMGKELPVYDEHVLDVFMPYQNNWIDEGIDKETAELFEIGFYFKQNQITIPHRNQEGELIGIRSRNTDERADMGLKYIPTKVGGQMFNHLTAKNLYGLHLTEKTIRRHKRIYIFEGEKSCMKSQLYFNNDNFSVAVSGSNVSEWQVNRILSLGVEDVVLAFDKFRAKKDGESDEVYERFLTEYKRKLARIGHKFAPYTRFFLLWDEEGLLEPKDSPIDCGKETFEKLTENKIEIQTKDVDF